MTLITSTTTRAVHVTRASDRATNKLHRPGGWPCLQQLQLYVPAGTRILGENYHLSPRPVSVHYTIVQNLNFNLITHFKRPSFTVTSIWAELSSPSYF
jgi:hypothetical protein